MIRLFRFSDQYRGSGVAIAGKSWLFSVRSRLHFYFIRPTGKPKYFRLYVGPFELEIRE